MGLFVSEFVIVSGLSGAGRTTAANAREDIGWFVVDNLPPSLITKVADLAQRPGSGAAKVAVVVGRDAYVDDFFVAIGELRDAGSTVRVLFLEAADEVLVRRYEGSRRRHPLVEQSIAEAVHSEREMLRPIKAAADIVIDTTGLNVHQLRQRINGLFDTAAPETSMRTSITSFGYKHGLPLDVDLVLDCRFLPNPHWIPELRPQTGLDAPVRDYVLGQPEASEFLDRVDSLFELLLPAFVKDGKAYLSIAIGCTGGHHRSVAISEELRTRIERRGFSPSITHRDIKK